MKVDGITLLQMIRDRKIPNKTRMLIRNWVELDFEDAYIVYDNKLYFIAHDIEGKEESIDLFSNFNYESILESIFEIIEEDKPIEKLRFTGDGKADYTSVIPKINELIDHINKLEERDSE